jgi:hypothetical protein
MSAEAANGPKGSGARRALIVAAGVAAAALVGVTSATSAAAAPVPAETQSGYPTDCHDYLVKNGWYSSCASGSGKYKSSVICKPWDGGPNFVRDADAWSTPGGASYSWVKCPAQSDAKSGGILYSS